MPKNWCFEIVVLDKTLESPLDYKGMNFKGNQPWIFIGRTDADTEAPILWPSDANSQLIWKDPDAGKDPRQEEKGVTEDVMVEWHQQFNGHEFVWTPGDSEVQGSLVWCSLWGSEKLDTTEKQQQKFLHGRCHGLHYISPYVKTLTPQCDCIRRWDL